MSLLHQLVDREAGAELGLEPCGLGRHDVAGVGDVDELLHRDRVEGEGDLHFAGVHAAGALARATGLIPADCKFKISAHAGHGNPCSAKLMEEIGADSFNIVRDYQLQHLAAVRAAINIPIDCHTENPESSGGFIRHYEVPEMIRVAAPIYLKTGGSVAKTHSWDSTNEDAKKRAKQVMLVKRVIDEYYPEALYSPKGSIKH